MTVVWRTPTKVREAVNLCLHGYRLAMAVKYVYSRPHGLILLQTLLGHGIALQLDHYVGLPLLTQFAL